MAPFPMATFSHTPYFFNKLTLVSPVVERPPRSESDFLLLPLERIDALRTSLFVPRRSLSVNFWPVSEWTEGGPFLVDVALWSPEEDVGVRGGAVEGGRDPTLFLLLVEGCRDAGCG